MLLYPPSQSVLPAIGARLYAYWGAGASHNTGTVVRHSMRGGAMGADIVTPSGELFWTEHIRSHGDLSPIGWQDTGGAAAEAMEIAELIALSWRVQGAKDAAKERAEQERVEAIARGRAIIAAHGLDQCPALIVAKLRQDESDLYADYHAASTVCTVVLARSTHTRSLFPEMRKAALLIEETMDLAINGSEHRENYSMGSGTYLSGQGGKYSGWIIRKERRWRETWDNEIAESLGRRCVLPAP